MWIAKQALQTAIPTPWIECQTDDADVFYYNTVTKESVWDHPYDSFYKSAISKFKSGEYTKGELISMVSQSWLLSGSDKRSSSMESPRVEADDLSSVVADSAAAPAIESPKLVIALSRSVDSCDMASSIADGLHAPSGSASPCRHRRRSSLSESQQGKPARTNSASKPAGSPSSGYSSRYSKPVPDSPQSASPEPVAPEVAKLRELLAASEQALDAAKAKIAELCVQIDTMTAANTARTEVLTADLLKSGEYIDVLLGDNKSLRVRMADAASKVQQIQRESVALKEKLGDESRKREFAEVQVKEMEARLRGAAVRRPQPLLARLCGSSAASTSIRVQQSEPSVSRRASRSQPGTPTSPEPYRDLIGLLAGASTPPPAMKVASPAQ